ncbi:beta-1,6-N-acetylglucosaminyltransferase [Sphingobacterium siyangense]|jgi:hypothetical protein|uniref:Beta-1,6-N-acetylglucosaminyltransferase n=2 Tax=Sphingobacterium TaxID=28453 RepID=A0ACD5BWH2_9SPHI|nr:beta-1,6-N-acetylglucosaminyltransferase [Sphingobacterium multivorum]VXC33121.1 conserved hypothetical protein [Sphingobacterium multivorum]
MRKIYIITAHKNPLQLNRLISVLNDSNSFFYIHLDLKSDLDTFKSIISSPNIYFIPNRVDCIWADFSQVEATLNLIDAVIENGIICSSQVTFLSGQDYPIKDLKYINKFLFENYGTSYITTESILKEDTGFLKKLYAYKINKSSNKNDFIFFSNKNPLKSVLFFLAGKINFDQLSIVLKKRVMPFAMEPFRGSNWWSMPIETLVSIKDFVNENYIELKSFFQYVVSADEYFFQTILMYLYKNDSDIVIKSSLTYDNWLREGVPLPVTFTVDDLDELVSQPDGKIFARKFDYDVDRNILDLLDSKYNLINK